MTLDAEKRLAQNDKPACEKNNDLPLSDLNSHPLTKKWSVDGYTILTAIERASDLTQRGIRGIIAEAVFENAVLPGIEYAGWVKQEVAEENLPFDSLIACGDLRVRIQIKLQRMEKHIPKMYQPRKSAQKYFVVEVQKTRSGMKNNMNTRPYRFSEFDILAVNMHPSTGNWSDFRYTLCKWLAPRNDDKNLIEIFQPVSPEINDDWTDDLLTCLAWLHDGREKQIGGVIQIVKSKANKQLKNRKQRRIKLSE